MPGHTRTRRYHRRVPRVKKTKSFRGFRKYRRYRTDPKGMIGFPKQRIVKMRYTLNFTLDSTGAVQTKAFAANNINQPDYGGTGKRPLGYTEWAGFYNQWIVVGSKIRILPIYSSITAGAMPLTYGIYMKSDNSTSAPLASLIEQGKCRFKNMQPINNGNYAPVSFNCSPKKWFNIANLKDNWDNMGSEFDLSGPGSDPARQIDFIVFVAAADGSTNVEPVNFTAQIDYLVLVRDPKTLPNSTYTPT